MRRDQPLMNVDLFLNEITLSGWADVACRNTVHELPVGLTSLYIRIPKMPRTEHGKNEYLAATAGRDYLVKDLVKTHSKTFKTGAKRSESSA